VLLKTRAYNNELRRKQHAELKTSIAAATAELHACKGVIATSYADIAKQAGVSLPTVYSHFPTQDELLQGCTGHVIAQAPVLPVEKILAAPDLQTAAKLLVAAMEQQHLHFEPWLGWREDRVIPFLAGMSAHIRQSRAALVSEVLACHKVPGARRELVAAWETVLSFDTWHRLTREHQLPRSAVRRILLQCLLAIIGPSPAPSSTTRPRRKS
jgi:AcrR family transcriptional regulator